MVTTEDVCMCVCVRVCVYVCVCVCVCEWVCVWVTHTKKEEEPPEAFLTRNISMTGCVGSIFPWVSKQASQSYCLCIQWPVSLLPSRFFFFFSVTTRRCHFIFCLKNGLVNSSSFLGGEPVLFAILKVSWMKFLDSANRCGCDKLRSIRKGDNDFLIQF